MSKIVLFGAGEYAKRIIGLVGKERIAFIIDNNDDKNGTKLGEIPVFSYAFKKNELKGFKIIIAVSDKYINEIKEQLDKDGLFNYMSFSELMVEITKKKIEDRFDCIAVYERAVNWIKENSINDEAIICHTNLKKGYPEVTGYYIPTLIRWGYRDLATNYAKWLISIQKEDGSWYDTNNQAAYIFDSSQILKGLLAERKILKDKKAIDKAIVKGCDWILSRMTDEGRLVTPETMCWGDNEDMCSEIVHLYCLSPIKEAGDIYGKSEYLDAVDKIFNYYKDNYYDNIMNFSLLSHFYAYVMEALLDLGHEDMCREAMAKIALKQKSSGAVPAYNNVDWVCSTGVFQLSLVWFRLGEIERGNKAFEYACKLQNPSGGWYGSYISEDNSEEENNYFPVAEISWANKYFLDALYYKNKVEFTNWLPNFMENIADEDGRYKLISNLVSSIGEEKRIIDVGCGKGRYINKLVYKYPFNEYFAIDITSDVKKYIKDDEIEVKEGILTNIPYDDKYFDIVYTCEALEHAIDLESAVREMARVTKEKGLIVVIDKNAEAYGEFDIEDWEQWPDEQCLKNMLLEFCSSVEVIHGLDYENSSNNNLFSAWIGKVR